MELAVQRLAALALVVVGLSHVLQPRAWARFFVMVRERGEAGVIANALLHLWPGTLIVAFHDVWSGVPAILTVYGWLLVVKSTLYLLWPSIGARALARLSEEKATRFALVGVPMLLLGLLLGWTALSRG